MNFDILKDRLNTLLAHFAVLELAEPDAVVLRARHHTLTEIERLLISVQDYDTGFIDARTLADVRRRIVQIEQAELDRVTGAQ